MKQTLLVLSFHMTPSKKLLLKSWKALTQYTTNKYKIVPFSRYRFCTLYLLKFEAAQLICNFIYWKTLDDANSKSAKTVVYHAGQILNKISLKTRIKLSTIYIPFDKDYSCDSEGLALFINGITNTTPFLSSDCRTIVSNNGAAHMLFTIQDSTTTLGIAKTASICTCDNRWVKDY